MLSLRLVLTNPSNWCRGLSSRHSIIDYSNVPVVNESDLEEDFVRGRGPGGQAVQKTNNCVVLKHKPTGLVVKCHDERSLEHNRKLARERLVHQLDAQVNGDMSIEAQKGRVDERKRKETVRRQKKRNEMKEKWLKSNEQE